MSVHAESAERTGRSGTRKAERGDDQAAAIAGLDLLRAVGWLVLHDVAVPGDVEVPIDHVLAGPSGVYVINTISAAGTIRMSDTSLLVGGVSAYDHVEDIAAAALALREELGGRPVVPILCFGRPDEVAGVVAKVAVCSTENILELLNGQPKVLDATAANEVMRKLRDTVERQSEARRVRPVEAVAEPEAKPRHREKAKGRKRLLGFGRSGGEEDVAPVELSIVAPLAEPVVEVPQVDEARLEAERLEAERAEAERLAAEEAVRAEAERVEAERLAAEEAARVEAERSAAEEAARAEAERVEAERLAAEEAARAEAERLAVEEAIRVAAEEEAARVEAERLAAEEAARVEAERLAAEEEAARVEAERLAAEEAARVEAERLAAEEAARVEAERLATEEAARVEAERLAAEEVARAEAERAEAERAEAERAEAERAEAERAEAERAEAERRAAQEAARVEAEQLAAEAAEAKAEVERLKAEKAAWLEAQEAARAEAERLAAEEAVQVEVERPRPTPARVKRPVEPVLEPVLEPVVEIEEDYLEDDYLEDDYLDDGYDEPFETVSVQAPQEPVPPPVVRQTRGQDQVDERPTTPPVGPAARRIDVRSAVKMVSAAFARRDEQPEFDLEELETAFQAETAEPALPAWFGGPKPVPVAPVAEPVADEPAKKRRVSLMPAVVGAIVVAVIFGVAPRVPDAYDWGKSFFVEPPPPVLGESAVIAQTGSHPTVQVMAGIALDVKSANGVTAPKGQHLVGVPVTLTNQGDVKWTVKITSAFKAVDTIGVPHVPASKVSKVTAGKVLPKRLQLVPGRTVTGMVVFAVGNGRDIGRVEVTLANGEPASIWNAETD